MRIITYQHKKVVDILMKNGEYKITNKRQIKTLLSLSGPYRGNRFPFAYQYMFNRMAKKIRNKSDYDEDIIAPIWGWYQVPDQSEQDFCNKRLYRITIEIDEHKVLLSDFGYYENFAIAGLNFIYYQDEEFMHSLYEKAKKDNNELIYKVYDKMIHKTHLKHSEYIQAVFYKIKMQDVIGIEKVLRKDWKDYRGPYYQITRPINERE